MLPRRQSLAEVRLTPEEARRLLAKLSRIYGVPPPRSYFLDSRQFEETLSKLAVGVSPECVLAFKLGDTIVFRNPVTAYTVLHEFRHYYQDKRGLNPADREADANAFASRILGIAEGSRLPAILALALLASSILLTL